MLKYLSQASQATTVSRFTMRPEKIYKKNSFLELDNYAEEKALTDVRDD